MKMNESDLLQIAVEVTKVAIGASSANLREVGKPGDTTAYLQAVYDKLKEINDSIG